MPNIKSAKKRLRTSEREYQENRPIRTRMRTSRRKFQEALDGGDKTAAEEAFKVYCSSLDKAAKRGVIKKNTSIRSKSRAADKIRSAG